MDNTIMLWFDTAHLINVETIKKTYLPKHSGLDWLEAEAVLKYLTNSRRFLDFVPHVPEDDRNAFRINQNGEAEIKRIKENDLLSGQIRKIKPEIFNLRTIAFIAIGSICLSAINLGIDVCKTSVIESQIEHILKHQDSLLYEARQTKTFLIDSFRDNNQLDTVPTH